MGLIGRMDLVTRGVMDFSRESNTWALVANVKRGNTASAKEAEEPEEDDEIDAVLKQIVNEDAQKTKKRKKGAAKPEAVAKPAGAEQKKAFVYCDWRSNRPVAKEASADLEKVE